MYSMIRLSPSRSQRVAAAIVRGARRVSHAIGRRTADVVARSNAAVDRLPPWSWPLLVMAAAWPNARWAARLLFEASEDALGIVALSALILAVWRSRARFGRTPPAASLGAAAMLVAWTHLALPEAVRALLMAAAVVVTLAAIADRDEPIAPYAGLAILALPLLSSLEQHAGFALRIITAQASRALLTAFGADAQRVGAALADRAGQAVADASGSGVQLLWIGAFAACLAGWMFGLSNRAFVARLPAVFVTVLVASVVRNATLVAADAGGVDMTDAMHAAIGLTSCAAVVAVVGVLFAEARSRRDAAGQQWPAAATLRGCRP